MVSNTEVKDGSLLAAVKSLCENFQWNINEQQDAIEFYMRNSFDAFLSENSLSTGFTVKVFGECRICSRVVTSESSMYTVLTIPICSDISGDNLSPLFLHEVKQIAKLKQCPCSCEDFFQCKSSLVATPECCASFSGAQQKESRKMINVLFLAFVCLFQQAKGIRSTNLKHALRI